MGVKQSKKSVKADKFKFDLIGKGTSGTFTLALNSDGLLEEIDSDSSTEIGNQSEVKYKPDQDKKKLEDEKLSNQLESISSIDDDDKGT